MPTAGRLKAKAAVLVGVGDPDKLTLDGLRRAAAAVARRARKVASVATTLASVGAGSRAPPMPRRRSPRAWCSARYQFLEYKRDGKPSKLAKVSDHRRRRRRGARRARRAVRRSPTRSSWARDLVNQPAKAKPPAEVAADARELLARPRRHRAGARRARSSASRRLGGVLGVGQGSDAGAAVPEADVRAGRCPRASRSRSSARAWCSTPVGCRSRPAGGMETMKTDMSGARGGDRARCRRCASSA